MSWKKLKEPSVFKVKTEQAEMHWELPKIP